MNNMNKIGESLESMAGGKTRGRWEEVRVKNGTFGTGNFTGRYSYEVSCSYNEKIDLSKSFFIVDDTLHQGAGGALGAVAAARAVDHCACLWSNMSCHINNTEIENITEVARSDAMHKKFNKPSAALQAIEELNGYVVGTGAAKHAAAANFTARQARDALFNHRETPWHPACSALFQKQIPQNCNLRVDLVADSSFSTKAVESATVTAGATNADYAYYIDDVRLYVWIESGYEVAPENSEYVLDLKACNVIRDSLTSATSQHLRYNVAPSTYAIGFGLQLATADSANPIAPTEFKTALAGGIERQISSFRMQYAGQQFSSPQYTLDATTGETLRGYPLLYAQGVMNGDFDLESAGWMTFQEWFRDPVFQFKVIKPEDDRSTALQVDFVSTDPSTANAIVYYEYSKAVYIRYDSAGNVTSVGVEEI